MLGWIGCQARFASESANMHNFQLGVPLQSAAGTKKLRLPLGAKHRECVGHLLFTTTLHYRARQSQGLGNSEQSGIQTQPRLAALWIGGQRSILSITKATDGLKDVTPQWGISQIGHCLRCEWMDRLSLPLTWSSKSTHWRQALSHRINGVLKKSTIAASQFTNCWLLVLKKDVKRKSHYIKKELRRIGGLQSLVHYPKSASFMAVHVNRLHA